MHGDMQTTQTALIREFRLNADAMAKRSPSRIREGTARSRISGSKSKLTDYVSPGYGGHGVMEGYEETRVSWRGMNRHGWAINSSTCHVHTHTYEVKYEARYMQRKHKHSAKNKESSGPRTH